MQTVNTRPVSSLTPIALTPIVFFCLLLTVPASGAYERPDDRHDDAGTAAKTIQTYRTERDQQTHQQDRGDDRDARPPRDASTPRDQPRSRDDSRSEPRPPRVESRTEPRSHDEPANREQPRPRAENRTGQRPEDNPAYRVPPRPDANRHYETRPRPPESRPYEPFWTYPYAWPSPRIRVLPRPHTHYRDIIILRPFPYSYPSYRRFYHNDDFWGWLAFTTITLAILDRLNDEQRMDHELALHLAITLPLGESSSWSRGYAHGTITPIWEGLSNTDEFCREFRHEITIGDETEVIYGTACEREDGAWEIVE